MLKTLDILIGATTILLLFSMAVTVITQAITSLLDKRGKHLLEGISGLLQQIGISSPAVAKQIGTALLKHPMIASIEGKLGTVIHRQEFTKLLMDLASGQGAASNLGSDALTALQQMLKNNGVSDPAQALKNIRAMELTIEASNPGLASHVREELAILQEASSDYVAKIHSWFDQTIDRVSQSFTRHAQRVTVVAAFVMVVVVQLDIIAVIDRLSVDDQFRNAIVNQAQSLSQSQAPAPGQQLPLADFAKQVASGSAPVDPHSYYNFLSNVGLVTLPTNQNWLTQIRDPRKYPGMIISILLISLGAPFWYNILKDLLGLRSALAQKDDQQRAQRQASSGDVSTGFPVDTGPGTAIIVGERGDLPAVG